MKTLIFGWLCHIIRMQEHRLLESMYKWKSITSTSGRRPKSKLKDHVLNNLKMMKFNNWMNGKNLLRR